MPIANGHNKEITTMASRSNAYRADKWGSYLASVGAATSEITIKTKEAITTTALAIGEHAPVAINGAASHTTALGIFYNLTHRIQPKLVTLSCIFERDPTSRRNNKSLKPFEGSEKTSKILN